MSTNSKEQLPNVHVFLLENGVWLRWWKKQVFGGYCMVVLKNRNIILMHGGGRCGKNAIRGKEHRGVRVGGFAGVALLARSGGAGAGRRRGAALRAGPPLRPGLGLAVAPYAAVVRVPPPGRRRRNRLPRC